MPVCGEKYSDLVRSASGRTPKAPCAGILHDLPVIGDVDIYCNIPDWNDWKLGMETIRTRAATKLAALQKSAAAKGRMDVVERIQAQYLQVAENTYNLTMAEAPSPAAFPGSDSITQGIFRAVTADELYACALDQLDQGFVEIGVSAPETAAPSKSSEAGPTDWARVLRNFGIAAGSAAFGYLLLKYYLARRQAQLAAAPPPHSGPPPI